MSIPDLNENESFGAASHLRSHWKLDPANEEDLEEIVSLVGGRLSYLSQVSIQSCQFPNNTSEFPGLKSFKIKRYG
jgi:hypothetical protein